VAGQDDLLLGALDGGEELGVVGFLEFLARLFFVYRSFSNPPRGNLVVRDGGVKHTTFVNCASATRFSASARTSSCSSTTSLGLSGSLSFSLAISSAILALLSRLGCTLFSMLRIVLSTLRLSSRAWAYVSSCSPTSERTTPTLSLMSLMASSPVCSPHSDSWVAIDTRCRPASSCAEMRLFSDLIRR